MYGFMYPPRPEKAIPPELVTFYQNLGWIAQVKKNGTCTVIIVSPDHELDIWTRHGERHKAWKPDPESPCLRAFKKLPRRWYVFVGELLHSKGIGIKDTLYLFDILVDGRSLVGKTYIQRVDILLKLWPILDTHLDYYNVDERLWIAKPLVNWDFLKLFNSLPKEDEGLVFKNPQAPLEICGKTSNQGWQVKCRKTTKNYKH